MARLTEKSNCWCLTHAEKAEFLIDGAAYFAAVADAIDQAQKTIFKLGWETHRRVFFHLDDQHPMGASQHQKVVVVDNQVAFCGGLDLSNSRWDTSKHRPDDPRRKTPDGHFYSPFHDIQVVLEGEAAAALGRLFTDRWKWATGKHIEQYSASGKSGSKSPWPKNLTPDLKDIRLGISRTLPAYKGRKASQLFKLAGKKLNYISRQIAKKGILTMAVIRNIPVAPFTIVNLIAGASHISLKDYLLGTAFGMLPGILIITIFADRLLDTITNPDWINALIVAVLAAALVTGNLWLTKRLSRIQKKNKFRPGR